VINDSHPSKLSPAKGNLKQRFDYESKSLSTTRSEIMNRRKAKFESEIASKLTAKALKSRFIAR
jgi:hypothetical protein